MNRPARGLMLALLLMLPVAREARADTEADAKAAYAKGREHFKAGRYNEAITELKKAYGLKPHPALLRYMGDTYFKLNKARLAIEHYKKYLKEAPEAPDKDKVEAKVRQLELIVGEEDKSAPPPPPPPPVPGDTTEQPTPDTTKKIDLQPTGEDREVPTALAKKGAPRTTSEPETPTDKPSRGRALPILKWTTLAVGVAGIAVGGTFFGLARKKAKDLERAAQNDVPVACEANPSASGCGGNPDLNAPVVQFNETHYNLQQSYKTNNTIGIAATIGGSVLLATGVVLFIVDRRATSSERRDRSAGLLRNVQLTPVVGAGSFGLAGEVGF